MAELLTDFPPGPLDFYRKKASFEWKKLKLFMFEEEEIRYKHSFYEELKKYPEFHPITRPLTFDEERQLAFKQSAIFRANEDKLFHVKFGRFNDVGTAAAIRIGLSIKIFTGVMQTVGSERHKKFIKQVADGEICGCFCLTEVGHGTNVKGMKTTATYDKNTKQFILHSPDFEAAKCWAGALGNTATHALLYAQLILEGKSYGLHMFIVPIRDPQTLIPYPGVTVGDMGEKMGLNGIDNGFLLFNQYPLPRENLLDKNGDVTEDGRYVTPFVDDSKRFGASLLALSATRVGVIISSELFGTKALTIAVRYAGVRKQFGPGDVEIPILEYQTQQYRLLPHLASVYMLHIFGRYLNVIFTEYLQSTLSGTARDDLEFLGIELHVITSAGKPVSGWIMRDAIQSSREACGGHGYLKAAGLGELKSNQDAALTYEGENWVLIQQTSNFLLKLWPNILQGIEVTSPLKSVDFFNNAADILSKSKFSSRNVEDICKPETILQIYQWLNCYLLKQTYDKRQGLLNNGVSKFDAKNDSQVFYGKKLGVAFIEHFFLQIFLQKVNGCSDTTLKPVLLDLVSLYGLHSLEKSLNVLYQGGFATGEQPTILIQDAIIDLCGKLKNEAVALVDSIAPPDFVLNSVLGSSDGQVYHRIQTSFFSSYYGAGRPTWWKDIVHWKDLPNVSAKL